MVRGLNRLWVRLLLASALGLAVALATAGVIAHNQATREYNAEVQRRRLFVENRAAQILAEYYQRFGWTDVQVEVSQLAAQSGDRILLLAPDGSVLADSAPGVTLPAAQSSPPMRVIVREIGPGVRVQVATVVFYPGGAPTPPHLPTFGNQLGRSLVLAGLVGFLAALAVSLALSRSIARPVEAVTRAARRMAGGDLDQRVPGEGPGELGELGRAFNAMAAAVSRSSRLRQDMVADVAHELRTPLTVMRGYLEALRDGVAPRDTEHLSIVYGEAVHLQQLVEDLQDLALSEAHQLELQREPLALGELVASIVAGFTLAAEARRMRLTCECAPDLPPVDADARRIGQVVRNLLANALAYTPDRGAVTVRVRPEGGDVEVSVTDTGPGIDPSEQPMIFERFYRADRSRQRRTGGAGLGLTIARRLVEDHGGTIGLDSQLGQGSTFWFRVPAAGSAGTPDRERPARPAQDRRPRSPAPSDPAAGRDGAGTRAGPAASAEGPGAAAEAPAEPDRLAGPTNVRP